MNLCQGTDIFVLNTNILQIDLKHFKSVYFTVQAHMATKMCVHTLSLSVESTQSLLPSGLPICPDCLPASHPVCQISAQSANCPRLPKTAQGHTGQNYFIVIQVSILWGPTQAHIFCYRGIVQECLIASQILHGQFYS